MKKEFLVSPLLYITVSGEDEGECFEAIDRLSGKSIRLSNPGIFGLAELIVIFSSAIEIDQEGRLVKSKEIYDALDVRQHNGQRRSDPSKG